MILIGSFDEQRKTLNRRRKDKIIRELNLGLKLGKESLPKMLKIGHNSNHNTEQIEQHILIA